jgi:protein-tyrosine kinase
MWFQKPRRPNQEATPAEAHFEATDADRPDAQPPSPFSVQGAPHGEPSKLALGAPNLLPEVRVWNEQIAQFKPDWRHLAHNLVICPGAPSGVVSAYNLLRTEALKRLRQNHWNTVAVTSPSRVSGNTLTAFNLAISMARDFGQSVLLVELNLVTPSFHRILGLGQRQGVADYLLHDASLSEILLDIGVERLAVIPAGSPVANSSELLSSPRMAQFVEEIRGRHGRLIALFDLPSVLAVDAAAAFSPLVDCALLVIEEGETRVDDVRRALRHLEATKILGIVLNRSIHGENEIGVISR